MTVRIGILGCGHFGSYHARAFSRLRNVRVTAFCNRTHERADSLASQLPGPSLVTTDADELFASTVDAVVIATHHDSHADLCRRAALAGKHVLVEKPLGMSLAECKELVDAVKGLEHLISVGYRFRFFPSVQRARELLPEPDMIYGQYMDDVWDPGWWAHDPRVGGGSVLSGACHTLDMLCYLAGSRPVRVYAEGSTRVHRDSPCLDQLYALITFANGATATCVQSQTAIPLRSGKQAFALTSTKGISIELYNRLQDATYRIGERTEQIARAGDEGIHYQARAFVAQIRGEAPPACGLADGFRANLLLEACLESQRQTQPVRITWAGSYPALAA